MKKRLMYSEVTEAGTEVGSGATELSKSLASPEELVLISKKVSGLTVSGEGVKTVTISDINFSVNSGKIVVELNKEAVERLGVEEVEPALSMLLENIKKIRSSMEGVNERGYVNNSDIGMAPIVKEFKTLVTKMKVESGELRGSLKDEGQSYV